MENRRDFRARKIESKERSSVLRVQSRERKQRKRTETYFPSYSRSEIRKIISLNLGEWNSPPYRLRSGAARITRRWIGALCSDFRCSNSGIVRSSPRPGQLRWVPEVEILAPGLQFFSPSSRHTGNYVLKSIIEKGFEIKNIPAGDVQSDRDWVFAGSLLCCGAELGFEGWIRETQ